MSRQLYLTMSEQGLDKVFLNIDIFITVEDIPDNQGCVSDSSIFINIFNFLSRFSFAQNIIGNAFSLTQIFAEAL